MPVYLRGFAGSQTKFNDLHCYITLFRWVNIFVLPKDTNRPFVTQITCSLLGISGHRVPCNAALHTYHVLKQYNTAINIIIINVVKIIL